MRNWMAFLLLAFALQAPALAQNMIRDADFSDIVQKPAQAGQKDHFGCQSGGLRQ